MFRLHWQQAASATSISESGTDYLYWVGYGLTRDVWPGILRVRDIGQGSANSCRSRNI